MSRTGGGATSPLPPRRHGLAITGLVIATLALGYLFYRGWTRAPKTHVPVAIVDVGALCIGAAIGGDAGAGTTGGSDVRADQPLAIGVRGPCLSDGCVKNRAGKCTTKREGSKIVVTSELSWSGPLDPDTYCSTTCSSIEAACTTEPLAAGKYVVSFGKTSTEVSVPSQLATRCSEGAGPRPELPKVASATPPIADAGVAANPKPVDPSVVPAAPGTGVVAAPPPKDIVCFGPANPKDTSRAMKAGQPMAITVIKKNPCTGASCAAAQPKCVVKRKGTKITVDAKFPGPTTKPRQPCTDDCSALVALCKTDGLPAGAYTIAIGEQQEHVTIPFSTPPPCAGQ